LADKAALRALIRSAPVAPDALCLAGCLACDALRAFSAYRCALTVASYMSLSDEPDMTDVNRMILDDRKRLLLPCVLSHSRMVFCQAENICALTRGAWGIPEPAAINPVNKADINLMIIPALAVSPAGVRLGRGRGYYDRYLSDAVFPVLAVVTADRIISGIPEEKHDRRVNYYIQEGVIQPCADFS
jgi:5-formyltetrahydrofolate cyclo-ligase